MGNDEKVQIVLRLTSDEREAIKDFAAESDKSMNQYILDTLLSNDDIKKDNNDSEKDNKDITFFIEQIKVKDSQIAELQKLLNQQQQLSLADKQEKEQLRLELKEVTPKEEQNRSFIQRLFNL